MLEASRPATASLFEVLVVDGQVLATWNVDALEALDPFRLAQVRLQLEVLARYAGLLAETALLIQQLAHPRCPT